MKMSKLLLWFVFAAGLSVAAGVAYPATFEWGRDLTDERTFSLNITGGQVTKLAGSVEETIRPYYEQISEDTPGESYTLEELGLDGERPAFGLELEQKWKYLTLGFNGFFFNPRADTTAVRDYYIGISNEIEYKGEKYEYMMIPEGREFTADFQAGFCELSILVTPVTVKPVQTFKFVPSLYLGIVSIFGYYDLDAGPPTGTTVYEDPPREYVIGGQTDGLAGLGIPAIGLGGEFRIGPPDGLRLVICGNYALFRYDGSTKYIPINIRHEKDLDLKYDGYEARVLLEVPLSPKIDLVVGAEYQHMKVDAEVTAVERTEEEIEELREKFDKVINLELSSLSGLVGLRF